MEKAAKLEETTSPDGVKAGPAWYVVCARSGQERIARDQLERQGYEPYLPMHAVVLKSGPKRGELELRPFFPRYLFVKTDLLRKPWRPMLSTIGVRSLLMSGDHPMSIGSRFVDKIRAHEEAGGFIRIADRPAPPPPRHVRGEKVRVVGTAFDRFEGVFVEQVDGKRVAILLSLLGGDSRVLLDASEIEKAV
jgi:transcriptional antiterminator RfaH